MQNYIDNAILDNFDSILDKSNYDKVTIKILKQFPCTYNRFENKKNLYIDKSNEKLEMTKSIGEDYTIDNTKVHTVNVEFVNDKYTSDTENDANSNDEDVKMVVGNYEIDKVENNSITYNENICQIKGNHAIDEKDELKNNGEDIEVLNGNHAVDCEKNITVNSNDVGVSGSHAIDDIYNYEDERNKISIESEQKEVEHTKFVQENENQSQAIYDKVDYKEENIENEFEDLNVLAKFSELMEKNNENDSSGAGDYISNLIKNNIQETDRIIAQILKKDVEHTTQNSVRDNAQDEIKTTEVQNVIQNQIKDETGNEIQNITQNETQNNCTWSEISKDNTLSIETTNAILMGKEEQAKDIVHNETIEKNEEKQALMVREEDIALPNQNSFFAKIWNKVKKLFAKLKTYRIGE